MSKRLIFCGTFPSSRLSFSCPLHPGEIIFIIFTINIRWKLFFKSFSFTITIVFSLPLNIFLGVSQNFFTRRSFSLIPTYLFQYSSVFRLLFRFPTLCSYAFPAAYLIAFFYSPLQQRGGRYLRGTLQLLAPWCQVRVQKNMFYNVVALNY